MTKVVDIIDAVSVIKDGDVILVGGFGPKGYPGRILRTLLRKTKTKDLFFVANATEVSFLSSLDKFLAERSRGFMATFIRGSKNAEILFNNKQLELISQGTFAERLRAGGKGIKAFYTPVGPGTDVAEGKEKSIFDGREYILEKAIKGDVALIRATKVDLEGNCFMRGASKNFTSLMPLAAKYTIVEAEELVQVGEIPPELITVPGKYIDKIVRVGA